MKKNKIIYGFLVLALSIFAIMYQDYLSSLIWAATIAIPLVLYGFMRLSVLKLRLHLKTNVRTVYPGVPVEVSLGISNGFIIPIVRSEISLGVKYAYYDEINEINLSMPIFLDNTQTVTYTIVPKHIGKVVLQVDSVYMVDFLGLFTKKVPLSAKCEINVMPDMEKNTIVIGRAFFFKTDESDNFSQQRGGDDPSEIYQIREYREGDKLQRIHWKLSAKKDEMMFKEGSLPIQTSATLFLDLFYDRANHNKKEMIDTAVLTLCTLSSAFLRDRLEHNVCWYNASSGSLISHRVVSDDDLFLVISELYASQVYDDEHRTMLTALQQQASQLNVRPIYVAPSIPEGLFDTMDGNVKNSLIVFEIGSFDAGSGESDKGAVRTICVDCHKPELALDNMIL